jgi:predicted TIM-barrel fold metal-dependent hydrolase
VTADFQAHWFPPACVEAIEGSSTYPRFVPGDEKHMIEVADGLGLRFPAVAVDLEAELADAERNGIDLLVCSPIMLGEVWDLDASQAAGFLLSVNAEYGKAQREHAGRFAGLAMLPLHHPEASLEVLDAAIADGLRGVCVLTSVDGRPIANERTLPLYRRLEEANMTVFLHPGYRSATRHEQNHASVETGVGWMYQTSAAALALITSGTLDACPGLRVVHPHLGGTLPFVCGRVDRFPLGAAKERLGHYLRRNFYADTASFTPGALQLAIDTYGLDRIVFGSDYPLWSIERCLEFVRQNARPDEAEAIVRNIPDGFGLTGE